MLDRFRMDQIEDEVSRLFMSLPGPRLDIRPPIDVFEVAKRLGIRLRQTSGKESYDGRLSSDPQIERHEIEYNPYQARCRQIFTVAHELGHYLLHTEKTAYRSATHTDSDPTLEKEADYFASCVVMKRSLVEQFVSKYFDRDFNDESAFDALVTEAAQAFRVSEYTAKLRLEELLRIPDGSEDW